MQLKIYRSEAKGMFGSTSFEYTITIVPNAQESSLIQKYKIDKEVIYEMERNLLGQKWSISFSVGDFLKGKTVKSKNLAELIELEGSVMSACEGIKIALSALSKIGKEEVIEF
jgi:hypothetical protein